MIKTEIISDNENIKASLIRLINDLKCNGCYFDSNLQIICNNNNLSVRTRNLVALNVNLIGISEECLLPFEDISLYLNDDEIVLSDYDSRLTSLRMDILNELINVFNLTKKVECHKSTHPATLKYSSNELYNKLLNGRNVGDDAFIINTNNSSDMFVQQMLKTRTMLYKRSDIQSGSQTHVIMPVLDFFNHHSSAGSFIKSGASFGNYKLSVSATIYDNVTREYFVKYGHYDAYDTFLRYGFVDTSVDFIYSIPMTVHIPFFGSIVINGMTGHNINAYTINNNTAEFQCLLLPCNANPLSTKHSLYSAIANMGGNLTRDKVNAYVEMSEKIIMSRNIEFYEDLQKYVTAPEVDSEESIILTNVLSLVDTQLKKLHSYL